MAYPTQIGRHDLLEIHGDMGARAGTIVLGTIIPIRQQVCYSFVGCALSHLLKMYMVQNSPLDPPVTDRAPGDTTPTSYDEKHLVTYLRLLQAEDEGADWREVARIVLHIDPESDPHRARTAYESHLARAKWMTEQGRFLRKGGAN
ncbi:hypothetical protein M2192_000320 [Bradyrhizobium elkanii USDA 61]|uniref:DUF2285 domain-containing protein n=2 Tax=Nitrobacteraceae TaxID=41294 RepID=A0A8I2C6W0_BRAEL|nr:hypothetical protein [Bradyrhizobium elkanii]MCS4003360.1 hypothetical protein [Bradyrhizobium elkanii USDA 61]MCP1933382.1 hypothetical protein [Bradyrhizobium elkanii]MCS3478607.1 hypothetical protein [Bradyrhizobium elkanii]MCS3585380.1 hypothetical protein [Bradyrhizobium elkanii]